MKKIEANLENLEKRTERLEDFQTIAKKDIDDVKEGINFTGQQLKDKTEAVEMAHQLYETQVAELTTKSQKNEDLLNEIYTKNLYLETYSRWENIKFMNIEELTGIGGRSGEDTEKVLRNFLERDLGYREARNVEIHRVHRIGKSKDGNPRPILARFLRYKDCQQLFLLGHRLKGTNFQMFREILFLRKSLFAAKYRWELLRMPGEMESLPPSANLNRISCISEVNCGRSGKNLLFN